MAANNAGGYGFLDNVRIKEGNDRCIALFSEICEKDKRRAVMLISDQRLTFPCLFILLPQIKTFEMERYLHPRAAMAQRIAAFVRWRGESGGEADVLTARPPGALPALRWILNSGGGEDGLGGDYDEVLDIAAAVLLAAYKDESALQTAIELLFRRNQKGRNIHYLSWAVFQIKSPQALKLIAQRVRSGNDPDVKLACGMLGMKDPDVNAQDSQQRYERYLRWLSDNDPYLYFSGESYQMSSEPVFYRIDLERKYLHRGTSHYERQPLDAADETQRMSLAAFKALSFEEKKVLAEYSHRAYKTNPAAWQQWLQRPVAEQLAAAKQNQEAPHDYNNGIFV